jgi:PTS system galactitol-specific IIB component
MTKLKVFIICGCGVATATAVEHQIQKVLRENGIDAETKKLRAGDTASSTGGAEQIVALTNLPVEVDVPVVQGVPFLTGVGKEAAIQELLAALAALED